MRSAKARLPALVLAFWYLCPLARASGVDPTRISLPKGPGSIEGLATVDFSPSVASGTASYQMPISVPPAAGGFGPSLAFAYDSGGGLTEMGIGWRISGVPRIRRRTEDGLPRFDATDRFELVGLGIPSPLIEMSPGVFRPSVEDGSFVRVQRSPDGDTWEARTKSGPILLFGGAGFAEANDDHVSAYLLREERDRHGHSISYEWDASEGHALLMRVTWNAFDGASRNDVQFDYETRPDPHQAFSSGISERLSRRLSRVTVSHGGALVRRYEVAYGDEPHPLLRSVELVGSDGTSRLPASRFEYTGARLSSGGTSVVTMVDSPGRTPSSKDVTLADLDGDGLPDLLVGAAGKFSSYANADGERWLGARDWGRASPSVSLSSKGVQLADLDADGAVDLVVKSGKDSLRYFPGAALDHFAAAVSIRTVPEFSFEDDDVRLADVDGDRRTDVLITTDAGIAVAFNRDGVDWTPPALVGAVYADELRAPVRFSDGFTTLCDVNGDRVEDLCALRSGAMSYWLGRGRGVFSSGVAAKGVPEFDAASPYELVDLDGDGWVDLVRVGTTAVELARATGEGSFGPVERIEGTPHRGPETAVEFADMNGSGTTDIVWVDVEGEGDVAWRYLEPFPDGRAGLLRKIDNGLGKVQTIDYAPAALAAARARKAGAPWSTRINVAIPVVARITVASSLGDPAVITDFTYRDGAFDPVERTFAAFGGATRRQRGDQRTPTLLTEQTFDTGLAHRELRGAALEEETRTEAGAVFSHVSHAYTSRTLVTAGSGEAVAYSFQSRERTTFVEGSGGAARTVLSETEQDDYGNVVEQRSFGEVVGVDPLAGNDEAITVRTYANDAGEWLLGFVATEELADAAGRRVAFTRRYYDGDPMRGLPLGQVTRGEVAREEAWIGPSSDAFELVIATRYDGDGQPIETTDGRGGGRYYQYASDHTSIKSERVKLAGEVPLVEVAEVDAAFGTLLAATDYGGETTRYEYDPFGRLTRVIKPGDTSDAPTVAYSYVASAPLSRVIVESRLRSGDVAVDRSEVLFDGLGRKRGTLTRDGNRWILAGVTLFDVRGEVQRALLPRGVGDAQHDSPPLLDASPPGGDTLRDALGREIRTRSVSGIETRTEYAPFETRRFDGGQADPSSRYEHTPTIERRDGLGRIVEHERTLEGKPVIARYTYDAAGALLQRTDPEGNVASYGYDGRGRRTLVRDPDAGRYELVYDATGNVVERRAPDGVVARFTFDRAGRALTDDWNGDGIADLTRVWDVDPETGGDPLLRGRLARVLEPSGSVAHTYDARGRVVATRYDIDGAVYTVGSQYDAQDREVRHVYPDGTSIEIRRNGRGQVTGYGDAVGFEYADDGVETARRLSSGARAETKYDDERRRSELSVISRAGSVIEHLRWEYDAAGNLVGVADLRNGVSLSEDRSETYAYDNLYRLVSAKGTWGNDAYAYSASGNSTSRESTLAGRRLGRLTYGERPHLPTNMGGAGVKADARGRITSDGVRDYTWNDADQLVDVSRSDGGRVKSVFGDGGVRRVRIERDGKGVETRTHFIDAWAEVEDGVLRRYIVHGGQRIVRLAAAEASQASSSSRSSLFSRWWSLGVLVSLLGSLLGLARVRRFRSGAAVLSALSVVVACHRDASRGEPAELTRNVHELHEGDTFIVGDLLGSIVVETTAAGEPVAAFATYPFGAARYDTSHSTWKYAASPRDGAVGLDHMGARFYAPELALWTSPDPVHISDPNRLVTAEFGAANPYAYANQTPLIAVDRDGHFLQVLGGALLGGAIGAGAELISQYLEHGRIEDFGKVGAAAAGGAVAGAITSICPGAAAFAVGGAGGGIARRLIESHGKSAGTLHEVATDASVAVIAHGLGKAAGSLGKALAPKVAGGISALGRVGRGVGEGIGGAAKAESAVALVARDISSAPQSGTALAKQLASEAQLGELAEGTGARISGPGAGAAFQDADRLAAEHGGNAGDWVKMSSGSFRAADGTAFATHWAENVTTGSRVETQVVFEAPQGP